MKVIDVKEKVKEGSPYVNYQIEFTTPYEKNGQFYDRIGRCQVSSSLINDLVAKGIIKTPKDLEGKNCFIGKSANGFLSEAERKYGFLNPDTILIMK